MSTLSITKISAVYLTPTVNEGSDQRRLFHIVGSAGHHRCLPLLVILYVVLSTSALFASNPPGSYQQTCNPISANGTTLTATCKNAGGQWVTTSLTNFNQCVGDIQNYNGQLSCNKGSTPPSGPYTQTCEYVSANGTTLNATCKNAGGQWVTTSLTNFSQCVGGIENYNGQLTCLGGSFPPGSYTRTCKYISVNGTTLNASCEFIGYVGQWEPTSLANFDKCVGDIANYQGKLTCVGGYPPPGSYQQTCSTFLINGNNLTASCSPLPGGQTYGVTSTLNNFNTCRGDIYNFHGTLACNRGTSNAPPGSYQQTCMDIDVNGSAISAQCETLAGNLDATSLKNTGNCSDIKNENGILDCIPMPASPPPPPTTPQITASLSGSGNSTILHLAGKQFVANSSVVIYVMDTNTHMRIVDYPSPLTSNGQGSVGPTQLPMPCSQRSISVQAVGGNQYSNFIYLVCQ